MTAPARGARRFPPHRIPEVRIVHVSNGGCGGPHAVCTVDFDPLPDDEFAPVVFDWPERDRRRNPEKWLPGELARALERGITAALDDLPPGVRAAAWCTVTRVHWHEVDSRESAFERAGAMAVERALRRCGFVAPDAGSERNKRLAPPPSGLRRSRPAR
ncbi:hypothetical protein ACIRPT_24770 [Streptomyces sp. NPDC101227]|uniref:hypothetical protein n=1 Tax=Streptomyces sp. NPDC101227 TaxID=3366136 RepID=UPI00382E9868